MDTNLYTWQEIQSQPLVWQAALDELKGWKPSLVDFYRQGRYDSVLFTGCGSTYYLSLAAGASYTQLTERLGRALPASELWLSPDSSLPASGRFLLVAVSRSGETSETINACQGFTESGRGDLITLTCYPQSKLASLGNLNMTFPASGEESFAQTRSFSTLYLATLYISALWGERLDLLAQMERLPDTASKLIANYTDLIRQFGGQSTLERYYFLGSGPRYGLAAELSLKMKEMSLSQSEPFHFMEFRHGPMSMVNEQTLLVGLVSTRNMPREMAVLQEMQARGAKILSLGEAGVTTPFDSGIDEAIRGPLYLPLGQILAFSNARSKGLNPDRLSGVQAVIRLGP